MATSDITLLNGDCLELMRDIPDNSIDMVLCDLPYGTTSCTWDAVVPFEPLWEQYKRIIKPHSAIVLFGSEPFSTDLRMSNRKWYKYEWYWDRKSTSGFLNAKKRPLKRIENILVFSDGKPPYNPQMVERGKVRNKGSHNKRSGTGDMVYGVFQNLKVKNNVYYPTNLLEFSNANHSNVLHPTQKPVELCEYLIRTYAIGGGCVLDNCMGSGTTGVACINTNRRFIGMELDKGYFNIAKERIKSVCSDKELICK